MRTNIEIDDTLVEEAQRLTGLKTKRAVVEEGLKALIRLKRQMKILELAGKVKFWDDIDDSRQATVFREMILVDSSVWIDHLRGVDHRTGRTALPSVDPGDRSYWSATQFSARYLPGRAIRRPSKDR